MRILALAGADGKLQRDAALRKDNAKVDALFPAARILVTWRGKLAYDPDAQSLLWLRADHPIVALTGLRIFLGHLDGVALFAVDLPNWQPVDPNPAAGFFDTAITAHPNLPQGTGFSDLRAILAQLSACDGECAAMATALFSWHASHSYCAACGAQSNATDAGWQRQCPACNAPHFPRTDPVVIMLVQHQDKVLLGRSPHWPEGMYSLLAGFVEPGEVVEAAVRREVAEETSVRVGAVRYVASQPWPFPASLMLGCIADAESTEITLDPDELQDALWLTRAEVLQVQLGHHTRVRPARKGAIAQYLIEEWLAGRID